MPGLTEVQWAANDRPFCFNGVARYCEGSMRWLILSGGDSTPHGTGFHIMLGADLPDLVRSQLGAVVTDFLADHDLKAGEVSAWVCHPGGPRVRDAVHDALDLPARALELAWRSLADVGNLSSASVLHILRDTLALRPPPPGSPGLLLAMGPGFCVELVLLRW